MGYGGGHGAWSSATPKYLTTIGYKVVGYAHCTAVEMQYNFSNIHVHVHPYYRTALGHSVIFYIVCTCTLALRMAYLVKEGSLGKF